MIQTNTILKANAASCLIFGLLFTAQSAQVAQFLGTAPQMYILILGLGLLVNGAHLFWASRTNPPRRLELAYFSFGDFLWGIATVILTSFDIFITTQMGKIAALAIAALVVTFGILQMMSLSRPNPDFHAQELRR